MKYSLLKSRTFWTIVGMAVVGAGNAVVPAIPAQYAAALEVLLGIMASVFHQQTGSSTTGTN